MVLGFKRNKIFLILILLFVSCKLFEAKDSTAPTVSLTIEGGNEISRGVTLYLVIDDDSKIDYVDIVIDDTTAITVTSNFDTIRFDVTPFADESEHQLSVKVADAEGNIGESEKLDVVITEFPGWRKYNEFDYEYGPYSFLVDDNNRIWIGWDGCKVYDPLSNNIREISFPDTINTTYIEDLVLVDGSRAWIATTHHFGEYHYELDKWLQIAVPPPDSAWRAVNGNNDDLQTFAYPAYIWSMAIDANYDIYIGTEGGQVSRYNGANFQEFRLSNRARDVFVIKVHPDGTIYYLSEGRQQSYIKNDIIIDYDNFPYEYYGGNKMIIDSDGNVWIEPLSGDYGCYIYDGNSWTNLRSSHAAESVYPLICTKSGLVYTETEEKDDNHGIATYDGETWTYFREFDSPFNIEKTPSVINYRPLIDEAPNGDIWMVLGNNLWRYRPSLGGYP